MLFKGWLNSQIQDYIIYWLKSSSHTMCHGCTFLLSDSMNIEYQRTARVKDGDATE
jgi:hypothetical protein